MVKKGSISEEDIANLLQRYSATTVVALLQEVAQVEDGKFDWNELVNKSKTGISNAREYQMLWRHLAYRDPLIDGLDDADEPLDDDSDLEYELEAFPTASPEASAEAAACARVLTASGSLVNNSTLPKGSMIEAPLTISIPNGHSASRYISVPISVPKVPMPPAKYAENLDAERPVSVKLPAPRSKRWSSSEDKELIAAVEKCGEGNWEDMLKGSFKRERSASQLEKRWSFIKKRNCNSTVGGGGPQLLEAQVAAARTAVNIALGDNVKPSSLTAGLSSSVKATAVAVGARIATPSNSNLHIPGGGLTKPTVAGNSNTLTSTVHFIRRPRNPVEPNGASFATETLWKSEKIPGNAQTAIKGKGGDDEKPEGMDICKNQ